MIGFIDEDLRALVRIKVGLPHSNDAEEITVKN